MRGDEFFNKSGKSIVPTVLIFVSLALVAAFVGLMLLGQFSDSLSPTSGSLIVKSPGFVVTVLDLHDNENDSSKNISFSLERKADGVETESIRFTLQDVNGVVKNYDSPLKINVYEKKTIFINFDSSGLGKLAKLSVFATLASENKTTWSLW